MLRLHSSLKFHKDSLSIIKVLVARVVVGAGLQLGSVCGSSDATCRSLLINLLFNLSPISFYSRHVYNSSIDCIFHP